MTKNCYKYDKKLLQIWQKIVTNMGATNEQTNGNKVPGKKQNKVSVLKQNKQSD